MSFGNSFFGTPRTVLRDLEVDGTTIVVDESNDRVGIGDSAPGTTLQIKGTAPYVTLQNSTSENSDGGCEAKIIFEDHANVALAQVEGSHSGSSDATKGKLILSTHTGSALTAAITIDETQKVTASSDAVVTGNVTTDGSVSLKEKASAISDTAAYGQLWVKTATPNQLYFTTDAGDDIQITSGTAMAFVGDITGVTAGVGLSGGGTTGAVTLTLDLSELSDVTPANGDKLATLDSDGANEQLTTVADLATLFAGTGLTASSSVIGVDASQTQITAVGTIATGVWQGTAIARSYIAADAIDGSKIDDDAIDSEHYANGSIDTDHIADNQVTLAKMAGLARGKIIYGDSSGDPAALAVGNANQVLGTDGTDIAWGDSSGTASNTADLILHMQVFS